MKRKRICLGCKNVYFFLLIGIFLLSFIPLINAAPPVTEVSLDFETGLEVSAPLVDYVRVNENLQLAIHVFNKSDGVIFNGTFPLPGTQCETHLFYPNGSIVLEQDAESHFDHFDFEIMGGNLSTFGVYCYTIHCNRTNQGGFLNECFEVNYSGKQLSSSQSILYISLLAMFILIIFATIFGIKLLPDSNTRDEEGKIMSISYLKYLRLPLWIFLYFLFIAIIFAFSNIALTFLQEKLFGDLLFAIFSILLSLSPLVVILIVISFFAKIIEDKKLKKMMSRGMFPQGKV